MIKLGVSASLLATAALALIAATAASAGNPHTTYTCTKPKKNGGADVRVSVPDTAISGLTNAGFTCVVEERTGEDDESVDDQSGGVTDQTVDDGSAQGGDEGPADDSTSADETNSDPGAGDPGKPGAGNLGDDGDQGNTDGAGDDTTPESDPQPLTGERWFSFVAAEPPSESRSLYCSTVGPAEPSDLDRPGIALDLPDSQGALLVEKGLATPAIFYEGVGASCDVLPGFTDSGTWVDHVGTVTGEGIYPYFVPAS
jgi:hypothetical protein